MRDRREEGTRDRNKQSGGRKKAAGQITGENHLCIITAGKHNTHTNKEECSGVLLKLQPATLHFTLHRYQSNNTYTYTHTHTQTHRHTDTHLVHGDSSPSRCSSCSGPRRSGNPGRGDAWSVQRTGGHCSCGSVRWPPYRTPHQDCERREGRRRTRRRRRERR